MLGEKILIEINVISLTQNITTLDQYDTESGVDADMKGHTRAFPMNNSGNVGVCSIARWSKSRDRAGLGGVVFGRRGVEYYRDREFEN